MQDKFFIMSFATKDFMKDEDGELLVFDDFDEAELVCGIYEFEDVWICKLISKIDW